MQTAGLFLTFEGIDGCGKTTQLELLAARLRDLGRKVVKTVEPGGTDIGRGIRAILLNPLHHHLSSGAELLLYFASRAQNVAEVIRPGLEQGAIVLCDRFSDSTIAYQGDGRGLDRNVIEGLNNIACGGLAPQLTLLLDIDLETSLTRAKDRNAAVRSLETRMDEQDGAFYGRVREGYRQLADRAPERIRVIDAGGSVEDVAERVWSAVEPHV